MQFDEWFLKRHPYLTVNNFKESMIYDSEWAAWHASIGHNAGDMLNLGEEWFTWDVAPDIGRRILTFSPIYNDENQQFRIVDSQFWNIISGATHWRYINPPI